MVFYINSLEINNFILLILSMADLVFIIAMQNEADAIILHMTNINTKSIYNFQIITWELFNRTVAIVICWVWKVNASRATQYAIDILWAKRIVNVWFAWWLNEFMDIWECYQIKAAVEYDFDLAELNRTDVWVLNEFSDKYLYTQEIAWFESKILGTWDRFNDSKTDYQLLINEIHADVRDMEWAAIIHTAIHANIPVFMFKCISDIAGNTPTIEQYQENVKLCSEKLSQTINKIVDSIP